MVCEFARPPTDDHVRQRLINRACGAMLATRAHRTLETVADGQRDFCPSTSSGILRRLRTSRSDPDGTDGWGLPRLACCCCGQRWRAWRLRRVAHEARGCPWLGGGRSRTDEW